MIKKFFNNNPRFVIAGVIGFVLFVSLWRLAFMTGVLPEPISRDQATERAIEFAAIEGWTDPGRLAMTVPIEGDELAESRASDGPGKAIMAVNPLWETWIVTSPRSITGVISSRQIPSPLLSLSMTRDGEVVQYIEMTSPIAAHGSMYLEKTRSIPMTELDNEKMFEPLPEDRVPPKDDELAEAVETSQAFFARHGLTVTSTPVVTAALESNRVRRIYLTWNEDRAAGFRETIRVVVANGKVAAFDRDAGNGRPAEASAHMTVVEQILNSLFGLVYLILLVLALVLLVLKKRQGEIDGRATIRFFVVFTALNLLSSATVVPFFVAFLGDLGGNSILWIAYIQIIFQVLAMSTITGAVLACVLAVAEGQAYIVWPRHLIQPFSSAVRGHFRSRELAEPVMAGYLAGFLALGAAAATGVFAPAHRVPSVAPVMALMYWPSAIAPVLQALVGAVTVSIIMGLFIMSYVRKWTKRPWIVLLVGTLGFLCARPFGSIDLAFPKAQWVAVLVLLGFAFGLSALMFRFGPLAMFIATFVYLSFLMSYPLVLTGNLVHAVAGGWGIALTFVPAVLAAYGARYPAEQSAGKIPLHVQRAIERLRIDQEFLVARQVQARLLPVAPPRVPGLDVAGICVPANEVGGDYFDYFHLSDDKFAIAIGDVSGKGVGAAIYMTLTKSYMVTSTSLARDPVNVLARVNDHLRRNLARGTFVTLTYGIVDLAARTLSYSRAGHNPALLIHGTGEGDFLNAPGVALGAAGSSMFQMATKAETVDLLPGDLLVFYTDGITEAMNLRGDEYGEDRLIQLVVSLARSNASSAAVMDSLLKDVRAFSGRAPQRDDITIVVIRIGA